MCFPSYPLISLLFSHHSNSHSRTNFFPNPQLYLSYSRNKEYPTLSQWSWGLGKEKEQEPWTLRNTLFFFLFLLASFFVFLVFRKQKAIGLFFFFSVGALPFFFYLFVFIYYCISPNFSSFYLFWIEEGKEWMRFSHGKSQVKICFLLFFSFPSPFTMKEYT